MVDRVVLCRVDESCHVGSPTRGGLALVWGRALLPFFVFKRLELSLCDFCSSDVKGCGLLADGQT